MSVQVKDIRNSLFHSSTFKVNDKTMKKMITQMVKLLEHGLLADDISAQNAVEDIEEVNHLQFASLYKYLLCLLLCILIVLCCPPVHVFAKQIPSVFSKKFET